MRRYHNAFSFVIVKPNHGGGLAEIKLGCSCFVAGLALLWPIQLLAQGASKPKSEFSFGVIVPIAINPANGYASSQRPRSGGHPGVAVGLWGEAAFFTSPRIALHTGIDLPRSYEEHYVHEGSAGFEASSRRRDVVAYELVGIHPDSGRAKPTWIVGGGVALSMNNTAVTHVNPVTGAPTQQESFQTTRPDLTIIGGLDFPIGTARETKLVVRFRVKATIRRQDESPYATDLGWFGVSPGLGCQIVF